MSISQNSRVEYTLSKPYPTRHDLESLCLAARQEGYRAISIPTSLAEPAYELLEGADIKLSCLIGFPFGGSDSDAKRFETETAVDHGAHEIELIPTLGRFADNDHKSVLREIRDVVEAADERPVKVAIELGLWSDAQLETIISTILDSGAQFLSTSVVPPLRAVTPDRVKFLRELVGTGFGLKIAVGRDTANLDELIAAGADRLTFFSPLGPITPGPSGLP